MTGKLPPHSPDMEQAALGSVLSVAEHSADESRKMVAQLRQSLFYEQHNKQIYTALYCLDKGGLPLNVLSVQQWLNEKGKLEDAGGLPYLAALPEKTATAVGFEHYLGILREKVTRRELMHLGTQTIEWAGDESRDAKALLQQITDLTAKIAINSSTRREWIRFYTPTQCRDYVPPAGHVLVGDCQVVRGMTTVIGGAPGVGKSRAGHGLAVAGATGADWFGMKVHCRFKTLIIQNENGRFRLSKEFSDIHGEGLDDYIRVSEPPAYGMAFDNAEFRAALAQYMADFAPDVVVFDPWNSVARDDKQKDYLETFQAIREVLPKVDASPALVIIAHTRKPKAEERANGRALLNVLAGSYVLGSVPRCVFVIQPASDDTEDNRIVWTCCKNNDGELGARTAWYRCNGLFKPCPNFDFVAFDVPSGNGKTEITEDDLSTIFEGGRQKLGRAKAVELLRKLKQCQKSAAYNALKADGRFGEHLSEADGLLSWKP